MRVYLDICAIQRPFDDQSQPRVRAEAEAVLSLLDLRKAGAVSLVTSGAHIVEIAKCPFPDRRAHVEDVMACRTSVPQAGLRYSNAHRRIRRAESNASTRSTSRRPLKQEQTSSARRMTGS